MRCWLLSLLACAVGCRTASSERPAWHEAAAARSAGPFLRDADDGHRTRETTFRTVSCDTLDSPQPSTLPDGPIRLTIEGAIRTTLAANPDLVALRQSEPVGAAALDVARTYPFNPQVGVDVRPFTREANGNNAATLVSTNVQQEFELAHQRRYREQAGVAELDRTRWTVLQAEIVATAATEQRFFAAIYQRQRLELADLLAELNQQMLEAIERRFEAGQASTTDRALAKIQAGTTRQQAELARSAYEASLVELRSQVGLPSTASIEPVGDLGKWSWQAFGGDSTEPATQPAPRVAPSVGRDGSVSARVDQWAAKRPDVRAADADVAAARARLDLACAARVPNLKAGPVYEHDESGTQFFGIEASIAIPVINTGGPLVLQRHAELHQRLATLEQLQLKAELEIRAAMERYERVRRVAEQFGPDYADKLADEVRRIEGQFEAGQTDLLRVYSARTSLIQSRQTYLDSLHEVARAAAAITAATGHGPEAFVSLSQESQP